MGTEESLAQEKKRNEELQRVNATLSSEIESLKLQFNALQNKNLQIQNQLEEEHQTTTLSLQQKEEQTLQLKQVVEVWHEGLR